MFNLTIIFQYGTQVWYLDAVLPAGLLMVNHWSITQGATIRERGSALCMKHSSCVYVKKAEMSSDVSRCPSWRQSSRWHRPATSRTHTHKQHAALVLDVTAGLRPKPDSLRHTLFTWAWQHRARTHAHSLSHAQQQLSVTHTCRITAFIFPLQRASCRTGTLRANTPPWIRADSSPVSLRQRRAALKPLSAACSLQTWQCRRRSRRNMFCGCWNIYLCFQKAAFYLRSSTQLAVAMRTQPQSHQSTAAMTPRGHTHCTGQTNFQVMHTGTLKT